MKPNLKYTQSPNRPIRYDPAYGGSGRTNPRWGLGLLACTRTSIMYLSVWDWACCEHRDPTWTSTELQTGDCFSLRESEVCTSEGVMTRCQGVLQASRWVKSPVILWLTTCNPPSALNPPHYWWCWAKHRHEKCCHTERIMGSFLLCCKQKPLMLSASQFLTQHCVIKRRTELSVCCRKCLVWESAADL